MTRTIQVLLLTTLLTLSQAYFQDIPHREKAKSLLNSFVDQFTTKYKSVSLDGLDFIEAMELGLGYWITRIRIHGFEQIKINYDVENDILEATAPEFHIDLVIDDKYTVPIKITDFTMSLIFHVDKTYFRCAEVELNYGSVSLDWNSVVEYISGSILSSDMIKNALKQAETPLRNLFHSALRNNHQRLQVLLNNLQNDEINIYDLVGSLQSIKNTKIVDQEFIFYIKDLFSFPSVRKVKDDL